jgi:acetoin utilization deacetylase AcuC-like enzyme
MSVAWLDHESFDTHVAGAGHPERPERLRAIREALDAGGQAARLTAVVPEAASLDQLAAIHDRGYVEGVRDLIAAGGRMAGGETGVVEGSWEAATRAAGGVVQATLAVLDGTHRRAFCSVRPPGHHARPAQAMGFCLFDNVAVAAQAALDSGGAERVAILDWDAHHGNGTQEIFYSRSDVLFASWHQYPFYPGTGAEDERGAGDGEGATVNCPLPAGSDGRDFMKAWEGRVRPALEDFEPDLVLVSAGFDADHRDPLAGLQVTTAQFEELSAAVVAWADAHCQGRVVSVLEGGYDLDALGEDVARHVDTLL